MGFDVAAVLRKKGGFENRIGEGIDEVEREERERGGMGEGERS